MFSDNSLLY